MAQSKATTVEDYLNELPPDRRAVIERVRAVILANLPAGYRETMNYGMISYEIPLERYPKTYNKQPLTYLGLAAQKNHYALYLMCVYGDPAAEQALAQGFADAGKKLDMGKSCLRFRRLDDLPLDVIGRAIKACTMEQYIAAFRRQREMRVEFLVEGLDQQRLPDHVATAVYRIDPGSGLAAMVLDDFDRPNGLCFSPDERRLYVVDSGSPRHIRAFDVAEGWRLVDVLLLHFSGDRLRPDSRVVGMGSSRNKAADRSGAEFENSDHHMQFHPAHYAYGRS